MYPDKFNRERLQLLYTSRPGPILDANKWYRVVGRFGLNLKEVSLMLAKVRK